MKLMIRKQLGACALLAVANAICAGAQTPTGQWDASLNVDGVRIPFRLDIATGGNGLVGTLYNGDDKETTTSAESQNGALVLRFDHYLTTIHATQKSGKLEGEV